MALRLQVDSHNSVEAQQLQVVEVQEPELTRLRKQKRR